MIHSRLGVPENHVNARKNVTTDNWWVHNRCTHIHYENSDKGKANLETWTEKHFSFPKKTHACTN